MNQQQATYLEYTVNRLGLEATYLLRPGSSDQKSVDETWKKNAYRRPSAGFDIEPGEEWADLGANIGAFTIFAATKGAKVVAWEPETDNAACIRRNASRNGQRIEIRQFAVTPDADDGRQLVFYVNHNPKAFRRHTLNSGYMGGREDKARKVEVTGYGFSRIIEEGFENIKMNIEGTEIPILMATPLETLAKIKKLVFEYSFDQDKRISTYGAVLARLNQAFSSVTASRKIDMTQATFNYYPPNVYLFCQNS